MRKSHLQAVALALAAGVVLVGVNVLEASPFSSGAPMIRQRCYTLAWLGSGRVPHDELREFQSLERDIADEFQLAGRIGITVATPVKVILLADTKFPARELWAVFGIVLDEALFAQLEKDLLPQKGRSGFPPMP